MISEDQQNLIREKMAELPENVAEAIKASGWEKKIYDIGRRYKLHIDDLGFLQMELALAMVGLSNQTNFTHEVKEKLGLSTETTDKIVEDVNAEIFSHIREKLQDDVLETAGEKLSYGEKMTMSRAGIKIDENARYGEDDAEETESDAPIPEEEETPGKPLKVNISKEGDSPQAAPSPETAEVKPKESQVFKTKVSVDTGGARPKNYFDPYREPVE